ncbi:MAG: winged helix-turn-helix domain-containing protein [Bdellovibrionales bacterium]|nr:winged helix-turn-helix domain-containing protein [Bdellovibrionales bacterium]
MSPKSQADYLFELGKARSLSGNFLGSTRLLEDAAGLYIKDKQYEKYMNCLCVLLRIYKELQNFRKIGHHKEELTQLVWEEDVQINPRIHYTLGQCALFTNDIDEAHEEFEKSFHKVWKLRKNALTENNHVGLLKSKIESVFPQYGMIYVHIRKHELRTAREKLRELKELMLYFRNLEKNDEEFRKTLFNTSDLYEIRQLLKNSNDMRTKVELTTELLHALILQEEKRYSDLERHLWSYYEKIQKSKDLCSIVTLFYYLGKTYTDLKDYNQATVFLNLAKKSIDSDNFKHLSYHVDIALNQLNTILNQDYDLIVNFENNSIIEKNKGRVDFKNQFILFDLFKMFISQPGTSYSKEALVEYLWKQKYQPGLHDNKIYVTIKRLRELMEPNSQHPIYIFRNKNGYHFNKKAKVLLKNKQHIQPEVML